MKIIYIARANTVLTKKGELWEMSWDMKYFTQVRSQGAVPIQLIQSFDKFFIALVDPKIFSAGGTKIYVTKDGINVDGKDIDVAEWVHYTDLFDKSSFKVQVVKYLGLHLTIDTMKAITEYYLLLQGTEGNASS